MRGVSTKTEGRGPCCASFKVQDPRWHAVDKVDSNDDSIIPVMTRSMAINEKSTGCFKEMTILPFGNTILLWCLGASCLMNNAMCLEVSLNCVSIWL
ncbi:hypothetical protein L3X38_041236 [Prunus dulcis]|uniref:Uncharacterized protein n=1 Tax=Prunus dulcis TaxID=3755 RepID=A0AAD4USU8_PRUDU|nr:hypothetical protein L3X38_041236 [Prunus dulcis]